MLINGLLVEMTKKAVNGAMRGVDAKAPCREILRERVEISLEVQCDS
jgi:chemotaxis regulatin CheY-phosphate phosphatase CheZ